MDPIFDTVWKEGLEEGIAKGREEGIEEGIAKGREKGIEEGSQNGISALIETYQEFHRTKDELLTKLMDKFNMTKDQATGYIQQYWI